MKILFLSRWFPLPQDNGSKIRVFNLIKHLSVSHEVDLISFVSGPVDEEQIKEMRKYCDRIETAKYQERKPGKIMAFFGLFSPTPRLLQDQFSHEIQQVTKRIGQEQKYDVVIASQMSMVPYAMSLPHQARIFEEIELTTFYDKYRRERNPLKRLRARLTWLKATRYIASTLKAFNGGTVVSGIEQGRVKRVYRGPAPVCIIPNGVDVTNLNGNFGPPEPDTLVFSGSLTYDANYDAVDYFLKEVFPIVKASRPGVRLRITGKLDGVTLENLANRDGVNFTGYLEDVRPIIATSWASIAPIRKGGGTRLKILESLALGTPVVATPKGAEGLDLTPGRDLLITEKPEDFANATLRLLESQRLREQTAQSGQRTAIEKYAWQKIGPRFCEFVEEVVMEAGSG